ncbi:MAG: hypothetical protein II864_05590 [Prevotella sp.]|nr:hypothetical protein [Prevotella sp.]MBR0048092.1 hypothetical protein [Prevotella sp.]
MNTDLIVQLLLAAIGATLAVIAVQLFRTKQREDAVLRSKSQYLYRLMHRISSLHALF